jgi:hypothetical protein
MRRSTIGSTVGVVEHKQKAWQFIFRDCFGNVAKLEE